MRGLKPEDALRGLLHIPDPEEAKRQAQDEWEREKRPRRKKKPPQADQE